MEFELEEIDGVPKAVFGGPDPFRNRLLSAFLHPAPFFVPDMLYELSLVERSAVRTSGFDTPDAIVEFLPDRVVIKSILSEDEEGEAPKLEISLAQAKLLLLEWGAARLRRQLEAERAKEAAGKKKKTDSKTKIGS